MGGEETEMTGGEETSRKDSDRDLDQYRDVDTRVRVQDYDDHAEMGTANGEDWTGQTKYGTDIAATRNSKSRHVSESGPLQRTFCAPCGWNWSPSLPLKWDRRHI